MGETVKFHCRVKHLGKINLKENFDFISTVGDRYIVWRQGINVLATGPLIVTVDQRFSVENHKNGNTLKIEGVVEKDSGDYVCQVMCCWIIQIPHKTVSDFHHDRYSFHPPQSRGLM